MNNDAPCISVVIPAYNSAHYIGRALHSVLCQRVQPFEVIVVDDGSTDGTADCVAAFGTAVRLIRQPNQGAAAARNTGVFAAQGTHIAFLDSDDYWLDTKLQAQRAVIQQNPSLVLLSTQWRWLPSRTDPGQTDFHGPEPDRQSVRILPGWSSLLPDPYLGTPTVVVRADRAREVGGFDQRLPSAEDVDFFLRVCDGAPYALLTQPLVVFQLRAGSLTQTERGSFYNLQVMDRLAERRPDLLHSHGTLLRDCRLDIYRRWVRNLLFRGKGRQARQRLQESRRLGTMPEYRRLYLKSWIAAPAARLRHLTRPSAHEAVAG